MTERHRTSYSGLKLLSKSSKLYYGQRVAKTIPRSKAANWSTLGQLYELLLLNDTESAAKYGILPKDHDGRTKAGKDRMAKIRQQGKEVVYHDTADRAATMVVNTVANPHARALVEEPGPIKKRFEFELGDLITVRGELDKFCENSLTVVDVKSTSKGLRPQAWGKTVARELYHMQAAIYVDYMRAETGCDDIGFSWIVCGTEAPYEAAVYDLTPEDLERGRVRFRELTARLERHITENNWLADYERERNTAELPSWA